MDCYPSLIQCFKAHFLHTAIIVDLHISKILRQQVSWENEGIKLFFEYIKHVCHVAWHHVSLVKFTLLSVSAVDTMQRLFSSLRADVCASWTMTFFRKTTVRCRCTNTHFPSAWSHFCQVPLTCQIRDAGVKQSLRLPVSCSLQSTTSHGKDINKCFHYSKNSSRPFFSLIRLVDQIFGINANPQWLLYTRHVPCKTAVLKKGHTDVRPNIQCKSIH